MSDFRVIKRCPLSLPVAVPMAPMRTAGMAIIMHPNDAENDRYLAWVDVLHERTLWKYTCQGIPPNICSV